MVSAHGEDADVMDAQRGIDSEESVVITAVSPVLVGAHYLAQARGLHTLDVARMADQFSECDENGLKRWKDGESIASVAALLDGEDS